MIALARGVTARVGRGGLVLVALLATSVAAQEPPPSHAAFDSLLREHVRGGLVDYDAFAESVVFDGYLRQLARVDPATLPRSEQLAFWINAYNAYTIRQITAHHERQSIKNINKAGGFLRLGGAWQEPMATIGGHAYTLDEIEHERIRPVYGEPRVHFALVCAARGCPPLRSEAFRAADLDQQLDEQARAFLTRTPTKNRVDVANQTVYLSPIFKWYGRDFGANDRAVQQWVARYLPPGPARDLLNSGRARVVWTAYDCSLNDSQPSHRQ